MKLKYQGNVLNGSLKIHNRSDFLKDLECFNDKNIILTIEPKKKIRSIEQNAYYWGVVVPMIRQGLIDVGYKVSKEQTHDLLRAKFAIDELVNEDTGEIIKTIASTTNMTTTDFMKYIESIIQWAAEYLSIQIPEPNEQIKIEL